MAVISRVRGVRTRWFALFGAFGAFVALMIAGAPAAGAHPLGNFTVNRYARLEVSAGTLRVYYVLDEAEIPTFQEGTAPKLDPVGFAQARAADLAAHLQVTLDGAGVALTPGRPELVLPPGQAGLDTLHLAVLLSAPVPGPPDAVHTVEFTDTNQPDHIGWREIVTVARGDARIGSTTAPTADLSRELTAYPGNLIQSPLDLRHVTVSFTAGSQAAAAEAFILPGKAVARAGAGFAALINRPRVGLLVLLGLLALSAGFGAVHALAPGHGKTIMAAYLVGTRGRPRDAVLLGTIVSLMHTASVLALGGALFAVSRNANPDRVYPYLKIGSGLAIGGWGIWLVSQRLGSLRRARRDGAPAERAPDALEPTRRLVHAGAPPAHADHDQHDHEQHEHGHHDHDHHAHDQHEHGQHDHDHGSPVHDHGPGGHSHDLPDGVAPLSRRGLILLATGGGLFPSPSAVLVLVSAFELHRTGLGLGLIAAFSVGLATTLTAVGLALVYGRQVIDRRTGYRAALRWLPVASAVAITVLGVVFAVNGLTGVR